MQLTINDHILKDQINICEDFNGYFTATGPHFESEARHSSPAAASQSPDEELSFCPRFPGQVPSSLSPVDVYFVLPFTLYI